jgi:hypothetical protein
LAAAGFGDASAAGDAPLAFGETVGNGAAGEGEDEGATGTDGPDEPSNDDGETSVVDDGVASAAPASLTALLQRQIPASAFHALRPIPQLPRVR